MHSNPILSPADWLSPRRAAVTSAHEKRMEKSSHRMCGALHDHYDDYLVLFIFAVAAQKKKIIIKQTTFEEIFIRHQGEKSLPQFWSVERRWPSPVNFTFMEKS